MSLGVFVTVKAPAKQSARSSMPGPLDPEAGLPTICPPGEWPEPDRPGGDLKKCSKIRQHSDSLDVLTSPWPWEETSALRALD